MQNNLTHPFRIFTSTRTRRRVLCGLIAAFAVPAAQAQSGTWTNLVDGSGSGSWANGANWNNGVVADGVDNTADFSTLDVTADSTVALDGARTVGHLIFGDTAPSHGWNLTTGSGGPLTLAVSTGQPTLHATSGSNNIAAVLRNTDLPSGLTKIGNGSIRLGAANLITNVINNINAGVLQVGQNNGLGYLNTSFGTVVGTNNVANGATLHILAGVQPVGQRAFIAGAGVGGTNGALRADAGAAANQQNTRFSFALNNAANPGIVLTGDAMIRVDGNPTHAGFLVGAITNNTEGLAYTLTKTGAAELRIDPAANIAISNIVVAEGILGLNGSGNLGGAQNVTVNSGAVIGGRRNTAFNSVNTSVRIDGTLELCYNPGAFNDATGFDQRIGTLSGTGVIRNSIQKNHTTLRVQSAVSNSLFAGTFATPFETNGPIVLRKSGADTTLRLTGTSSHRGTNIVEGGALIINGAMNPEGGYIVNNGATLGGNGTITVPITINSGSLVAGDPNGTLTVNNVLATGGETIMVSNANLKVNGPLGSSIAYAGTLYLTNGTLNLKLLTGGASVFASSVINDGSTVITYTSDNPLLGQFPLISYGSLSGLAGGDTNGFTLVPPAGTSAYLSNNIANNSLDVVVTSIPALVWRGTPTGDWEIGGSANWLNGATPGTYIETAGSGPFVTFDDSAAGTSSVNVSTTVSPKGVTVNNETKNYTFTGAGSIAGPGGLLKQGAGTLTIANENAFSGSVVISGGTVEIGNGGTSGNVAAAGIANAGQLTLNRSDDFSVTSPLTGAGTVVKQGTGAATVALGGDVSGAVTVNGGTLAFAPTGSNVVSGDVTGSGAFGMAGAGTLVLSSFNNSYSGGTVISNGTLRIESVLPAGNVENNGMLALAISGAIPNNISGSGGVSVLNFSSVTLGGANSYAGPTTLLDGTLDVTAAGQLPSASSVVLGSVSGGAASGQLNLNGVNQTVGGLVAGGNGTPNTITFQSGNQTLVVNGNLAVGNNAANATVALTLVDPVSLNSTLAVVTNGGFIQTGLNSVAANADRVMIDLSQIGTFYADLGASGALRMGTLGDIPASANALSPNLFVLAAASNSISAGAFYIGAGGMQNQPQLLLGTGTNILNADNIYLGTGFGVANRDSGIIKFYDSPSVAGSVRIRGFAGGDSRANLRLGDSNAGTGAGGTNIVDFSGHYADLLLGSLVLGNQPNRVGAWEQTFSFDQGMLDALNVSLSGGKNAGSANPGFSTMNIGGGVASLGAVSLTASAADGTLNISGGATVTVQSIADTGAGTSTLDLNGARLNIEIQGTGNPASAPVLVDVFNASATVNLGVSASSLAVGQFPLIKYSGAIGGSGFSALNLVSLPPGVAATLVDNAGNSSVDLLVTSAPSVINPNPTNILTSVTGNQLTLSWPSSHIGWLLQSNSVSLANTGAWFTVAGSGSTNLFTYPVDKTRTNVFFRMVKP